MSNSGFGFYATHPGEVLKDELEARGISQRKFAESIGMGYSVLNEILNGKRPVTTTSALMFEAALDIPADSLLKLQMGYNMHTAQKDNALKEKAKADSQSCSYALKTRMRSRNVNAFFII